MKKGYKFNIIDIVVILIVLVVIVFIAHKFSVGVIEDPAVLTQYEFKFYASEVPDFVIDYIEEGSEVHDGDTDSIFGNVVDFTIGESELYNVDSNGEIVKSVKPDHSSVELVVNGTGEQTEYGVKIDEGVYGVGHSLILKFGNAKIYAKISGIKEINQSKE